MRLVNWLLDLTDDLQWKIWAWFLFLTCSSRQIEIEVCKTFDVKLDESHSRTYVYTYENLYRISTAVLQSIYEFNYEQGNHGMRDLDLNTLRTYLGLRENPKAYWKYCINRGGRKHSLEDFQRHTR